MPAVKQAAWCTAYANAAYMPFEHVENYLKTAGLFVPGDELKPLTEKSLLYDVEVFGHWRKKDNACIIFARGTELGFRDFLTDANLLPAKVKGLRGHRGMLKAADAVYANVVRFAYAKGYPAGAKRYFVGHSLGGAVSLALACMIGDKAAHVVTFGMPRCLRKSTGKRIFDGDGLTHNRWVNAEDKVARVLWYLYRHYGALHFITPDGDLLTGKEAQKAASGMRARSVLSFGVRGFTRHGIAKYAARIAGL